MIKWRFVLRFAGLGSVVERSATKAAIAQASLSAARGFGKDSALMEPRTNCGPRASRGAALESLAAPLAPIKCVSAPKLSEPAPRRSPN